MQSFRLAIVVTTRDFFCAFAKLRKSTLNVVVSVLRPFVWKRSAAAGQSFVKMYLGVSFTKVGQAKSSLVTTGQK